jgi:ADP-ribose pyrophosphatase
MPIVYKGRVFSVEVTSHPPPGGSDHEIAIVRHPPSVVLIPTPDATHVILVRQYRHSVGRDMWELPAGSLEAGESAQEAAARECEEEIALRPARVERLISLFPTPGYCDEEMIFFRVSDLGRPPADSPHRPDDDEDILARAVTIAEARAMVERGDIIDLKTAYGLTLI